MSDPVEPITAERAFARGFADRLPLLVNQVGYQMAGRAEPRLAELGLNGKTYMALAVLVADRPGSQLELARLMGSVAAVIVTVADNLEAEGYVERTRDPADRRRSLLTVTPAGRRALAKADRIAAEVEDDMLGHLDGSERARLHATLRGALERGPRAVP